MRQDIFPSVYVMSYLTPTPVSCYLQLSFEGMETKRLDLSELTWQVRDRAESRTLAWFSHSLPPARRWIPTAQGKTGQQQGSRGHHRRCPCQSHSLQTGVKGSFSQRGPGLWRTVIHCVLEQGLAPAPIWHPSGMTLGGTTVQSEAPAHQGTGQALGCTVLAGRLSTFRFQEERTCLGGPAACAHTPPQNAGLPLHQNH